MKQSNKANGNRFEQRLSKMLAKAGFWVHVIQQNKAGQPADIIAVKGHYHTLIDCKVISNEKGFPFRRIEENQKMAMWLFTERCDEACWFALELPDESVWMLSMNTIRKMMDSGMKGISEEELRNHPWTIEKWLTSADVWSRGDI